MLRGQIPRDRVLREIKDSISVLNGEICVTSAFFRIAGGGPHGANALLRRKGQAYPAKRGAAARSDDFAEIARAYAIDRAEEQSSRCSQCGVPYCAVHCPLHNHIPDWLKLTAEGRLREA